MTIARAQANATAASAGAVSTLAGTFGGTPTQNNLLVVTAVSDSTMNLPTGSGWSLAVSAVNNCGLYIWYKVAGAAESATVTVNNTASATCVMCAMEWSGLLTASVLDKTASNGGVSGSSTIASGTTAATTQADELAIAAIADYNQAALALTSWSGGFTTEYDLRPSSGTIRDEGAAASLILTSTGAQSSTASLNTPCGANSTGCIATFKAAAAAGATSFLPRSPYRGRLHNLAR